MQLPATLRHSERARQRVTGKLPSRPFASSPRGALICLLNLLWQSAACQPPAAEQSLRSYTQVLGSLVSETERWKIASTHSSDHVVQRSITPVGSATRDDTPLPSILLHPPAKLEINLAGLPANAELNYCLGFDRADYAGPSGSVEFRLTTSTGAEISEVLAYGADVPPPEREWRVRRLALQGAHSLSLETRARAGDSKVSAAFARLRVERVQQIPGRAATPAQPNCILILVDTLRADRLGAERNGVALTPRLDALAASGTKFTQAWSAAPWTWPSTASVLTGLAPPEHGVLDEKSGTLPLELDTLAESLQTAGWATAAFSVNPLIRAATNFDQGFELFQAYSWASANEVVSAVLEQARLWREQRFFFYLHLGDPHEYEPDRAFRRQLKLRPPEGFTPLALRDLLQARMRGEAVDEALLSEWLNYKRGLYDASVAQVDHAVGQLLDGLLAEGLLDKTCIAFTSDHGEEFLEHGLVGHARQLHEESTAVPLLIAGPGIPQELVRQPVENRQLAATLLARLKQAGPAFALGVNLLDAKSRSDTAKAPLFFHTRLGGFQDPQAGTWRDLIELWGIRHAGELHVRAVAPDGSFTGRATWRDNTRVELDESSAAALERSMAQWFADGARRQPRRVLQDTSGLELLQQLGYLDPSKESAEQDD